jgi:hypothetical protein
MNPVAQGAKGDLPAFLQKIPWRLAGKAVAVCEKDRKLWGQRACRQAGQAAILRGM